MTIQERMQAFDQRYGREMEIGGICWHYFRLGHGAPLLWLTGGLRRARLGFAFMERLSARHTLIAPDYPPLMKLDEFITAFDAILQAEGVERFTLAGQSYGGLLAQAMLAHRPPRVERLLLSSSGPADLGPSWLPVEWAAIALARRLPEKHVKNLLAAGLLKVVSLPEEESKEWRQVILGILQDELTRADVISHFAVAADLIRRRWVTREAFSNWRGRVIVLSAENDLTQSRKDIPRYERLFGQVEVLPMGEMGHTAAIFNPDGYTALLERALS